jgi:hypothetical protein
MFISAWIKFIAWWKHWSPYCVKYGHIKVTIRGSDRNLGHQKGGIRPVIYYFSGNYTYCGRIGCEWNEYRGERRAIGREEVNMASKI